MRTTCKSEKVKPAAPRGEGEPADLNRRRKDRQAQAVSEHIVGILRDMLWKLPKNQSHS